MRIVLLAAQSVDGFITEHDRPGSGFASDEDQQQFHAALRECDCSVMGRATYEVARDEIRKHLTNRRLRVVMTRSPAAHHRDVVAGALEFSSASAADIAANLRARGLQRCAVLGGSQVNALFLAAGLVDELWITIEPRVFGQGTPFVNQVLHARLKLESCDRLNADTLLLKYAVDRNG